MSLVKSVIDAVAKDINDNAGLPEHGTVRYRRPRVILPQDCPLLVVWLITKSPVAQTTEWFDGAIQVAVSWHEETVEEASTLMDDENLSLSLLDATEKIEARIRHLALKGLGVDGAWEFLPSDTLYLPPEMQSGLVEGYHVAAVVRVTETAPEEEISG